MYLQLTDGEWTSFSLSEKLDSNRGKEITKKYNDLKTLGGIDWMVFHTPNGVRWFKEDHVKQFHIVY